MLEVSNSTRFAEALVPYTDIDGRDHCLIVIKGSFDIRPRSGSVSIAERQVPIVFGDEFHGEPGLSSIKYESETCPPKPGGDVVLLGHAYSVRPGDKQVDVTVQLGQLRKTVRVVGNRIWQIGMRGWSYSNPEPFEKIPLIYERAFGGRDETHADRKMHSFEPRNPVGTGFAVQATKERLEGLALPNLEDVGKPIRSFERGPVPAGFGFVGRDWQPRAALAGTYDDAWQQRRAPLLPPDFDPTYYNAASTGLVASQPFTGGEPVRVTHAHPGGEYAFELPRHRLSVTAWIKGEARRAAPALDTVLIETDEGRLVLLWRAAIPCPREQLYIDNVFIKEGES